MLSRSPFTPWVEKTASRLARGVDDIFCSTALNPPKLMGSRSSAEGLNHAARMRALSAIGAFYAPDDFLARGSHFFSGQRTQWRQHAARALHDLRTRVLCIAARAQRSRRASQT